MLSALFIMYLVFDDSTEEIKRNTLWLIKNDPLTIYYLIGLFLIACLIILFFTNLKENNTVEVWLNKLTKIHINKLFIIISSLIVIASIALAIYTIYIDKI